MKFIKQFAKEAPRTFAITVGWVLFLVGMLVWITVDSGFWVALGVLAASIVIGIGLHLLNRWAAKGDGLDR